MQKLLVVLTLIGMCGLLNAGWETIGPCGGYMRSIAISPVDNNTLYATSYSSPTRVFKSTDAGFSWNEVGSFNSYNYCMTIGSTGVLYTAYYYYVYRSTNGGVTWTPSSGITNTYIYDLEAHPTNPNIIYGCGRKYISSGNYAMTFLKSTDAGASWTTLDLVSGGYCYGYGVGVDPSNPDIIYCGGAAYNTSYEPKIFKSTDGGATFSQVYSNTVGYYVYDVAVHPTNSNVVYACTYYDGIYRSTDGGSTWSKVSTYNYNYRLATSPADPDYVYCSGYAYFRRSTNAGLSWTTAENGLCGSYNYGLAVNPTNSAMVFVANRAGVFKTTNSASNWFLSSDGIELGLPVVAATAAPSNPTTVYCQVEDIGVYKTTDCGTEWNLCPSFSSCGDMCAIAIKYNDPDYVMAIEGLG